MCTFEFNIPINKESLLESSSDSYYVRDIVIISSLKDQLKNARDAFNCDGPEAILNMFDIYYSILFHADKLGIDIIVKVIKDLTKPCKDMCNHLEQTLNDSEIPIEIRLKTLNILKMLMYLFTQTVIILENKIETKNKTDFSAIKKGRKLKSKKQDDNDLDLEKQKQLNLLQNLLQLPISKLWDPPICEEAFINLIANLSFSFLLNPSIKYDKEICDALFVIFGILIKKYNYSMNFTIRLTQAIKDNEHLEAIVPNGIRILVEEYNCVRLVRELVRELTEWQSNEAYQDAPGSRHCSFILIEMTALMPELMLPEVVYLLRYLSNTSYTLRNCILSIITEVIITVLCKEDMSEEQILIRNNLLDRLKLHICDVNAHVRSKVVQHWARLHSESAIPKTMQLDVLKKASGRLHDKATLVRKNAVELVITFLKCNPYAANLELDKYKKELEEETNKYNSIRFPVNMNDNIKSKDEEWNKIKKDVLKVIQKCLESDEDDMEIDEDASNKSEELLKNYLDSGKYKQAFLICRDLVKTDNNFRDIIENYSQDKQSEFFLSFMGSVFVGMNKEAMSLIEENLQQLSKLSPEKIEEMKKCELNIKYLEDVVEFLEIIEGNFPDMISLLKSSTMTDVNEAIQFFVTAHQFRIKCAQKGLAAMLTQMNTTEQERKNLVIDAYRTVFLSYDGNPKDKPQIFCKRLIDLLKSINANDEQYLTIVVMQWAEKGDLDNSVIQYLWRLFIGHEEAENDDRLAALNLLLMIATGKKTTIERNMNLVAEMIFGDKGIEDPRFLIIGCQMLSLMETEINVTDQNAGFRVPIEDNMWEQLVNCLLRVFLKKDPFCHSVFSSAVGLIYKICQKPDILCTKLIQNVVSAIKDPNSKIIEEEKVDAIHLSFFCHLLGEVAIRQFAFLDVSVYKELKRRNNLKDEQKKTQKTKEIHNISKASASHRVIATSEDLEESYLEGATAEDVDAEFILNVCECEIVTKNLLGQFVPMLVYILKHPNKIDGEILHASAAQALMRFMTVSSELCQLNINLIMTLLEKSKFRAVKNNIFVSLADLLHRFPNLIEPWSQNIYRVVKDEDEEVRMTAVSILSKLIMEDMLRVKGTVADLALCICDKSEIIVQQTEEFFTLLAQKGNTIYNVLPDIISRLSNKKEQIDEDIFKKVMTFLINLINKDKQIESLVEKLCLRFKLSDKVRVWTDIAFCLTILNYNDKSLLRLKNNYPNYKVCLEEDDVYELFMMIIHKYRTTTGEEMKNIVKSFEQLIKTGEVTEEENINDTTNRTSKSKKSKRAKVQFI